VTDKKPAGKPYQPGTGESRFFPHLAGSLILASAGLMTYLGLWESSGRPILTVYPDKLARNLPTVCKGLTHHVTTTPIIVGQVWTEAKCEAEERRATIKVQERLAMCFKFHPGQVIFDMATSHAWNNGAGATCGSAAMRAWNVQDWRLGCRRLAFADSGRHVWSYVKTGRKLANGKPEYTFVQGLANRRGDEYRICLQGAP
jgi:lysozyme